MYNNLETYFCDNVISPYLEYIGETQSGSFGRNNDLRKAVDCSHKLYHLREHLNPKPSCHTIIGLCPEYKILQDINNLSKHAAPSRDNPKISNLNQIIQLVIIARFEDEAGWYSDVDKVVKIIKDDGSELFLHDVLYSVISFWNDYLYNKGLITKKFKLKAPNPIGEFIQRSDCKKMEIEHIQGMPFIMHTQLKNWDYEKNVAVPVDLTDAQVKFTIRKPPVLTPHIQIKNEETGEILEIDIILAEEDSKKFNSFETDQERASFTESLEYVHKQIIDHWEKIKK